MELIFNLIWLAGWFVSATCKVLWRVAIFLFRASRPGRETRADAQGVVDAPTSAAANSVEAPAIEPERFAPADRIHLVDFAGDYSCRLYVYNDRAEVRRVIVKKKTDGAAQRALQALGRTREHALLSTRVELTCMSLKDHTLDEIFRDTEIAGVQAIRKLLVDQQRCIADPSDTAAPAVEAQQLVGSTTAANALADQPQNSAPASEGQSGVGTAVSARVARKGVPITGVVLSAQETEAIFGDGKKGGGKGKTFEVTIDSAGQEISMRGVVLREEFMRLGIQTGDRVSITPLGRRKVLDGENTKSFMRNLFEVQMLPRAT